MNFLNIYPTISCLIRKGALGTNMLSKECSIKINELFTTVSCRKVSKFI